MAMFECSACTLRTLRAIAGDVPVAGRIHRQLLSTAGRRLVSTAVASSPTSHGQPYLNAAQLRHINRQKRYGDGNGGGGGGGDGGGDGDGDGVAQALLKPSEWGEQRALHEEMKWLSDSFKFAEHVHFTLRCEQPDKALQLCRLASSQMECVVAWNHCVDWHLKHGQYNDGLRIYNEMKKRGQFPDSYTYIILLRGLTVHRDHHVLQTVKDSNAMKALAIYTSMSSPTSRVQPAIMHTNAALKATAQAADLDAFWGIVARIPEHGPGAADHIAYTTILDCIRFDASRFIEDDEEATEQNAVKRVRAIDHGRRVWQEVVYKWRAGLIKIDERLVGTMARLLLISHRMVDWDNVLSLIQQTTQIERQIAPIGSANRQVEHVPAEVGDALEAAMPAAVSGEAEHDRETPAAKAFEMVRPPEETERRRSKGIRFQYVTPSNGILSAILEACTVMRIPKTAVAYWELLINNYTVKPDYNNAITYVKILKQSRASKKVAKLMSEDLRDVLTDKMLLFRLALETCIRDLKNMHAPEHATTVVNTMEEILHPATDVITLQHFLRLGCATKDGRALRQVVERLYQSLPALRHQLQHNMPPALSDKELSLHKNREEITKLLQEFVGAIDVLMARHRDTLTDEDVEIWKGRKNEVTGLIGQGVEKYVAWAAENSSRSQTRKRHPVFKYSIASERTRYELGQKSDERQNHESPFSPKTPYPRTQELQDGARADFDDRSDALNEKVTELRQASGAHTITPVPRLGPRISLHISDRKDHRLTAMLQNMHRQENRKQFRAKQEELPQNLYLMFNSMRARMLRMERWGGMGSQTDTDES